MAPSAYATAALDHELERVRSALPGARGTTLFRSAAALGQLVGGGELVEQDVAQFLLDAGVTLGLDLRTAASHVHRGLREGARQPRAAPPPGHGRASSPMQPATGALASRLTEPVAPTRPPHHEVEALWSACGPTAEDAQVAEYLRAQRSLDPDALDLWGAARALPTGMRMPSWAACKGMPWSLTGHRLVLRVFDATGSPVSLRARCIRPVEESLKALAPGGYRVKGTVLACPLGVQVLQSGPPTWWTPHHVLVVEGEPDFLTWVTRQGDASEQGPAVFGLFAGGWSDDIAARIPDAVTVILRTHHDEAGEGYARRVYESLAGRCKVRRSPPGDSR